MTAGRRLRAALSVVTFAVSFVFSWSPQAAGMSLPGSLAISAAATAAVWLSARRPVAALATSAALTAGLPLIGSTFAVLDLVVVFVVFQVVLLADLRPGAVAALCLLLLTVNDAWLRTADGRGFMEPGVLYPLLLTCLAVGLGLQSRRVRRQHDELLALRETDRRRAVSDERRRIARDLHDAAAHHLSALVVRNKLATRVATNAALEDAARFTATTAADTLDALRRVVHVLHTDDDDTGEDAAPLAPGPRLSDIDGVVATMEQAGLQVRRRDAATCDGPGPADVPVDVAGAAVRIVTEALANVLHHRGPGRCWLEVHHAPPVLTVCVEDDGPGTWLSAAAGPTWHVPGHYGVTGMRERARSCGGRLDVGPSARGGWRVSAVLPVDPIP